MISNFDAVGSLLVAFFVMTDPLMLAVLIGAIQNVFSKSSKYTFFDSTKEMAYVPFIMHNSNHQMNGFSTYPFFFNNWKDYIPEFLPKT